MTPQVSTESLLETVREILTPDRLRPEQGFCYVAVLRLGRAGDREGTSRCVLREGKRPLGPGGALHADIRAQGRGRYSHWTPEALYFSASDNSDPRQNGRCYTLESRQRVNRRVSTLDATGPVTQFQLAASEGMTIRNRRVVFRNLDERAALVPHFRLLGGPDLSSRQGMLASILRPGMTEEEKAVAIWRFLVDWRYHDYPAEGGDEVHDPVKFLNVYGYGFCDDCAANFAVLCREAGMRARIWGLSGHVVGEVFYQGAWHMFDPDHEVFYRMPDGAIASVEQLAANPGLITARPRDPIGSDSAVIARLYSTQEDNRPEERRPVGQAQLDPVLEPGDEVTFELLGGNQVHRREFRDMPLPPLFGNGELRRRIRWAAGERVEELRLSWPYVLLGGRLTLQLRQGAGPQPLEVLAAAGGGKETPLGIEWEGESMHVALDPWMERAGEAVYGLVLRVKAKDGRCLPDQFEGGTWRVSFQFAPRSMPQVGPGGSAFMLRLAGRDGGPLPPDCRGLRVRQEWDEVVEEAAGAL